MTDVTISIVYYYFQQVLYSLKWDDGEDKDAGSEQGRQSPAHHVELTSKRAFTEIFGDAGTSEIKQHWFYRGGLTGLTTYSGARPSQEGSANTYQAPKSSVSLLNGAPHVLPPMSILCQHYLNALLPLSQTEPAPK